VNGFDDLANVDQLRIAEHRPLNATGTSDRQLNLIKTDRTLINRFTYVSLAIFGEVARLAFFCRN
jgi:hypothetical protein